MRGEERRVRGEGVGGGGGRISAPAFLSTVGTQEPEGRGNTAPTMRGAPATCCRNSGAFLLHFAQPQVTGLAPGSGGGELPDTGGGWARSWRGKGEKSGGTARAHPAPQVPAPSPLPRGAARAAPAAREGGDGCPLLPPRLGAACGTWGGGRRPGQRVLPCRGAGAARGWPLPGKERSGRGKRRD